MKKVVVGISGGVDSSVAALILKNQGYEVIGVTFILTDEVNINDAKKICETLEIEHHIVDYRKIFKEEVIDKFLNDYKKGLTPNPCVACNRTIKINFLYEKMKEYNADYIATGHYAKVKDGKLYKSADQNKDQTYFLSNITKQQLQKILLPLEGIDKETVRKIARENNLISATKKDSTDICFISNDFKKYMVNNIESKIGDVVNVINNSVIGKHSGLTKYTIGQRRGLNIGGTKDRMYVVGKDINKNILYIATGEDNEYLISTSCILENVNILSDELPKQCTAKFRYRSEEIDVTIKKLENNTVEVFYNAVKSVTPGQVCVFYSNKECLGCGIIKEVRKNQEKLWYL